ncbi:MAG TPA: hypothetical protein VN380_03885 [Thermoanaerobaculia bacterium]|nr:hypothetical protein [Thermoanaerobaculia bacterium]
MKPEEGIDWRVTLDPQSWLPKTMVHKEGNRTITVTFVSYETVDGLQFEKEIHRTTGDPRFEAVIRFTKTVINPPLDASFFSIKMRPSLPSRSLRGRTIERKWWPSLGHQRRRPWGPSRSSRTFRLTALHWCRE